MSIRRMLFLLVALIASGSTIVVGRMWLQSQKPAPVVAEAQPEVTVPLVLVAKGNIPAGTFLRPENLRWEHWPENGIAPSYVLSTKRTFEDYAGAVVRVGLNDGEPITDARVLKPGDKGFLAAVLTPGSRAITVNLTPSSGLAGLVFPGDRVDLVASFKIEFENKQGTTHLPRYASETVESNLRVLAVDQRVDDQNKEIVVAKTATLEVTPKQAEVIAIVGEIGKFSLSLRSLPTEGEQDPSDQEAANSYTWDNEAARMLAPVGASGTGKTVTIVRGGDAKEVEMPGRSR